MTDDVSRLVSELELASWKAYFTDAEHEAADKIICRLRVLYRQFPKDFSPDVVQTICNLKSVISMKPFPPGYRPPSAIADYGIVESDADRGWW